MAHAAIPKANANKLLNNNHSPLSNLLKASAPADALLYINVEKFAQLTNFS